MTLGARIVLVLFIASLVAGAVTGNPVYYRIGYIFGLVLVVSWLWSRYVLRGLRLKRYLRATRAQVGQILEERIEIENPGRLPRLLVAIRDESTLPGARVSRLFSLIEGHRGRTYLSRTQLIQRGNFMLGPTLLESGDPFGLFPVQVSFPAEESILVYPLLAEIDQFPQPPGIMPGGEALRRRTSQVTPNASGVRDYAVGDPLNRIHWVSTARRGRLISKEFELDPQAEVWLFLDAYSYGQASLPYVVKAPEVEDLWKRRAEMTLPPSTEEYEICVAASLARFYLRQGRAVGFVSVGQSRSIIPPDRGGRQLSKILESCALLHAKGMLPLRALVEIQVQHLMRGSTAILITHSVEKEIALTADFLTRRGLRPILILIEAASFGGPSGTDQLAEMVRAIGVPLRVIRKDDPIGTTLSATPENRVYH